MNESLRSSIFRDTSGSVAMNTRRVARRKPGRSWAKACGGFGLATAGRMIPTLTRSCSRGCAVAGLTQLPRAWKSEFTARTARKSTRSAALPRSWLEGSRLRSSAASKPWPKPAVHDQCRPFGRGNVSALSLFYFTKAGSRSLRR